MTRVISGTETIPEFPFFSLKGGFLALQAFIPIVKSSNPEQNVKIPVLRIQGGYSDQTQSNQKSQQTRHLFIDPNHFHRALPIYESDLLAIVFITLQIRTNAQGGVYPTPRQQYGKILLAV
jgi:hypothetical protein